MLEKLPELNKKVVNFLQHTYIFMKKKKINYIGSKKKISDLMFFVYLKKTMHMQGRPTFPTFDPFKSLACFIHSGKNM